MVGCIRTMYEIIGQVDLTLQCGEHFETSAKVKVPRFLRLSQGWFVDGMYVTHLHRPTVPDLHMYARTQSMGWCIVLRNKEGTDRLIPYSEKEFRDVTSQDHSSLWGRCAADSLMLERSPCRASNVMQLAQYHFFCFNGGALTVRVD